MPVLTQWPEPTRPESARTVFPEGEPNPVDSPVAPGRAGSDYERMAGRAAAFRGASCAVRRELAAEGKTAEESPPTLWQSRAERSRAECRCQRPKTHPSSNRSQPEQWAMVAVASQRRHSAAFGRSISCRATCSAKAGSAWMRATTSSAILSTSIGPKGTCPAV